MGIEARGGDQRLARRVDSSFNLTQRGLCAHELVSINEILSNHSDPGVAFSMSDDIYSRLSLRREDLLDALGLPSDEVARKRKIKTYKTRLEEVGYPHWRRVTNGK